jgi:hypothetical protein
MIPEQNLKDAEVADVEFVLSECIRLNELTRHMEPKELIKYLSQTNVSGYLPLPNGGEILCGMDAIVRLHDLAMRALRESDAAGTVEAEKVYEALKRLFVPYFRDKDGKPQTAEVGALLAAAIDEAKRARSDATHYVPCRLMFVKRPTEFAVGPVTFRTAESFHELMSTRFATYAESGDSPEQRAQCARLLAEAQHYYNGFGWVGEVRILQCDPKTSKQRGLLAVTAALDILHLLFGAYHTDRMVAGGPRLAEDRRAHFHMDADGMLDVSCSSSSTSAVGFQDGWDKVFEREDFAFLLRTASKAIEPLVDPSIKRPLGVRFVDAASWFGDAVREQSQAARIVKASNALEHLLTIGQRSHGITKRLKERAAAVCYDPGGAETFHELAALFGRAYSLRSDLVHGSLSPFDPEVEQACEPVLRLAQRALCSTLAFFQSRNLLDRPIANAELAREFSQLIRWAKGAPRRT